MPENPFANQETSFFGKAVKRREDPRFITGTGTYVDDMALAGQAYAAMLRSPYPHARITRIDTGAAEAHPGVIGVITGQQLLDDGVGSIPTGWLLPELVTPPHYAIAAERVRHVGEIVACVVAEDRATAVDATALIEVEYEALDAVAHTDKAEGGATVHDEAPDNVAFRWEIGDENAVSSAFDDAAHVVRLELTNQRLVPNAIEPRASLASYNPGTDEYTLYTTSQNPHIHRLMLAAFVLNIPEHKLRVVSPDVGGGFGSKIFQYPEEVVVLWAARHLGRPVKWTATRSEAFLTDSHGRDHVTSAEMAVDDQQRVTGLRVVTSANLGAYLTTFAPAVPTYLYGTLLSGQYKIPAIHCKVTGVFSHTTPVDAYRGAGRPEATYLVERMMSRAAQQLGVDPVEFRRSNFIGPDEFPYQTPVALVYDSGDYEPALDKALEMLDYAAFRQEQTDARAQGRYLGLGISSYIEACGLAPSKVVGSLGAQAGQWESSLVRVAPTGKVEVFTGTHSHGQGHETAFAQIVADQLGVDIGDVEVVHGDTGKMPFGWGTYGSRSAAVGASAIVTAVDKVKDKVKKIAAHLLEAREEDIEYDRGTLSVAGSPDKSVSFGDVALQAHLAHDYPEGLEPGLEATAFYDPSNFVYPFGHHLAMVEIDPDTGDTTLLRYVCVDDCGPLINPMIAEGQVHGGVAQGFGQAILEGAVYDEGGTLLNGSYLDYALPRAEHLPSFEVGHTVTPSPHNPLGVKGIGEAGTIASTAAVANAVIDALEPFGITHLDMPLTPQKVWRAIQASRPASAAD